MKLNEVVPLRSFERVPAERGQGGIGTDFHPVWAPVVAIALSVLFFGALKVAVDVDIHGPYGPWSIWIALAVPVAAALGFSFVQYPSGSELGFFARTIAVAVSGYLLATQPHYAPMGSLSSGSSVQILLNWCVYGSALFGGLSLWRPSFALVPLWALTVVKSGMSQASGLSISSTDYIAAVELGVLAVTGILIAAALDWARIRSVGRSWRWLIPDGRTARTAVFWGLLAVHLANYFYAAVEKLALSGPWFSWLSNETYNIFLVAQLYNMVPVMHWDPVLEVLDWMLKEGYLALNIFVLLSQITCFFALIWRRLAWLYLLAFDAMHIGIWLASGIFFWKWILINTAFIWLLRRPAQVRISKWVGVACIGLLVIAPAGFKITRLGWYDTRQVNHIHWNAVLASGERVPLSGNFFRNYSVTFAQNRVGRYSGPHFATGGFGISKSWEVYNNSYECSNRLISGSNEKGYRISEIETFITGYHEFLVTEFDEDGMPPFNWFPHHIWYNVFVYDRAVEIALSDIVAYEMVLDAVCLVPTEEGRVTSYLQAKTVHRMPIDE